MLKRRLDKLLKNPEKIAIDDKSKIIFFSDCHRGVGGQADDFAHNQLLYIAALNYYLEKGFTYIELGDGDELWENKNFESIKATYRTIFEKFDEFHKNNRFYFIWGNHNRRWKNSGKFQNQFSSVIDPATRERKSILLRVKAYEALVLVYKKDEKKKILLVHGHQGELLNDTFWWLGRYFVRKVWKILQKCGGFPDPTSPAKNYHRQRKADQKFRKWVEHSKVPMIIGHTHKSVFPPQGEIPYFNDGSCVHPRCITGIEIINGKIQLIKWFVSMRQDNNNLFITKSELENPRSLNTIFEIPE